MSFNSFSDLACGPKKTIKNLISVLAANRVPFIQGSPGISKSDVVKEVAKKFNLELIDIRLSQVEPCDLLGFPFMDGDRSDYKPMKMFPLDTDALPEGKQGWLLFFDEFNSANREVQAASYRIILDREIGSHKLHPNCFMVCAGNKSGDGAIVNKLSTALQSRLIHLFMEPSLDDWVDWAINNNIDSRIITYLYAKPTHLTTFDPESYDVSYACPRTWHMLSDIISNTATEELDELFNVVAGTIGKGAAVEFISFCKLSNEVPSIQEIVKNPKTAPIPDQIGSKYFLISSIASVMDKTNVAKLLEYADRIPNQELLVLLFRITAKGKHAKELINETCYTSRAVKFAKDYS